MFFPSAVLTKCVFVFPVTKSLGPKPFHLPFRAQDDLLARAIAQGPKTVDVPASLPTPPHNNQEELRQVLFLPQHCVVVPYLCNVCTHA